MPTEDGREIKPHKLIRSGKLYDLPKSTVKALEKMGVTTVIDLRIPAEINDKPDTNVNCTYVQLPLLCTATAGITHEPNMRLMMKNESYRIKEEFGTADNYMIETYRSVLFNEQPQEYLKKFLRIVVEEEGCVLFHCVSGKDRAGICAMLLEFLLGVSEEIVLEDYLLSRKFWRGRYFLNKLGLAIVPVSFRFKRILFGFMRTKKEYLKTVIDEINSRYGSVVQYCKEVLNVTDEDIDILRKKYLV